MMRQSPRQTELTFSGLLEAEEENFDENDM